MYTSPYRLSKTIIKTRFFSCDLYYMKAHAIEKMHYHDGLEIVYIIKGSCKTHKQNHFYIYTKGKPHKVINDSNKELKILTLTFPPETENNTHYVE